MENTNEKERKINCTFAKLCPIICVDDARISNVPTPTTTKNYSIEQPV